jgi:hypothetical protein
MKIFAEKFGVFLLSILLADEKLDHSIGFQEKTPTFQ